MSHLVAGLQYESLFATRVRHRASRDHECSRTKPSDACASASSDPLRRRVSLMLRLFPRSCRRRLDIPVEQRIAVSQLRVSDGKLRIEFDGALESFDRLSQAFRGASRGVVTTGGVELSRLFVFSCPMFAAPDSVLAK